MRAAYSSVQFLPDLFTASGIQGAAVQRFSREDFRDPPLAVQRRPCQDNETLLESLSMKKSVSAPELPPLNKRRRLNVGFWVLFAAAIAGGLFALSQVVQDTGDRVNEPGPTPAGMVWVPGGFFTMGSNVFPDAQPLHRVWVDGFWMDRTEVTNDEFAKFTEATGYQTIAERTPTKEDFPNATPEQLAGKLVPFSLVFTPPAQCPPGGNCDQWWKITPGACWKHPEGPASDIKDRGNHPVVHIAWEDAKAYAVWAKKRLPTEAQWERAARGGKEDLPFYWGTEFLPEGKWRANIFQGDFPSTNSRADGYATTAPVGSYPANEYGLYDMSGNVWEWCSDWYRPGFEVDPGRERRNPKGPASSQDTHGNEEPKRVQRGGSFLCSDAFCARYQAGGRQQGEPKTGLSHTGFRCVVSPAGWGN
jgi:formylglycine-generating enzyme required for sulfatase activity